MNSSCQIVPRSLEFFVDFFGHEFTYMFQVLAKAEMELSLRLPNEKNKYKQEALADDEKNKHY